MCFILQETVVTFTLTNPSIFKTVVKLMPVGDASNQGYMTAEVFLYIYDNVAIVFSRVPSLLFHLFFISLFVLPLSQQYCTIICH